MGLAAELGKHKVAVNVLNPLRSVITEGFQAQRPDAYFSACTTPEALVNAVVYLARQDAHGLTGSLR